MKYKINMKAYEVAGTGEPFPYPTRENLCTWLQEIGMFVSGGDVFAAVSLANSIQGFDRDYVILTEQQLIMVQHVVNTLLKKTQQGKAALGGPAHNEMICRIFNPKEVEADE